MDRLFSFLAISIFIFGCSSPATTDEQKVVEATTVSQTVENVKAEINNQTTSVEGQEKKLSITEEPADTPSGAVKKEVAKKQNLTLKTAETKVKEAKPDLEIVSAKATSAVKETVDIVEATPIQTPQKPSHDNWNKMLQTYVSSSGKVNYSSWKSNTSELNNYINELGADSPNKSWSRSEKMAYWMNLYNAATIKLILDNYPVKSIMDINNGKPWNKKWIKVGSATYSLNQIENDIIRPRFGDGRIHFAINCAAKSCPPISNKAFTASNLSSSLHRLTKNFVNNTAFNKISPDQLKLSNIFNWYATDFGDLKAFLGKYTDVEINADATISFIDYDWALNSK